MANGALTTAGTGDYVKVANFPGLYRHLRSGLYYGVKKLHGKRHERSMRTADRKIAERRYREWSGNLAAVDHSLEKTTLRQLLDKFVAINAGRSAKTRATDRSIIRRLQSSWPGGVDVQVRNLRPSHLDAWLAAQEKRLKNTSYNRYAGFLKQLFDIALRDRIIAESPFKGVRCAWKKPQEPLRLVPTEAQFVAIVREIRSQKHNRRADVSANFVEFLGRAGLGQAEAASRTWPDVDWELRRLNVQRRKTGARYHVPLYPDLYQLLLRMQSHRRRSGRLFSINDAKHALRSACERLGYPQFTQRSIRRCLIRQLWRAGVDKKLIAKWQGHQDGGQLIIDTYTEAFGDDDTEYEQQQLARLET
jgi:site-specific recombinase XerD